MTDPELYQISRLCDTGVHAPLSGESSTGRCPGCDCQCHAYSRGKVRTRSES